MPKEALKQLSQIALSMVTQVPPMICSEPIKFNEKFHAIKESKWQDNISDYELVYYRPVLFYGIHGAVAAQGQVGNRACPDSSSEKSQNNYQFNEKDGEQLPEQDKTSQGSLKSINENGQLKESKDDIESSKQEEIPDDDEVKNKIPEKNETDVYEENDTNGQEANNVNKDTDNDDA